MTRPRLSFEIRFGLGWAIFLLCMLLAASRIHAQTPIPVTGHFEDAGGGSSLTGAYLSAQLTNCAGNQPRIFGHFGILQPVATLPIDGTTGLLSGSLWPNDLINCGGVTGSTSYLVTFVLGNVPQGQPQCFVVSSTGPNPFSFDTATPCTSITPPPGPTPPYDATYRNLTLTGVLGGGSAVMTGTVQAHKFLLDFTPAPCSSGSVMTGYNADFTVLCVALPAIPVNSVFGRIGPVTAQTGDYTCAQVTGCITSLPTTYYQQVGFGGTFLTQRAKLNFLSGTGTTANCVDNPSGNSTDCSVNVSGATRTCNANGCYRTSADGTIEAWGSVTVAATGNYYATATITFPVAFSTSATVTSLSLAGTYTTDNTTPASAQLTSAPTLTGASVYLARTIVAGAGGGNFDQTTTLYWFAIGY